MNKDWFSFYVPIGCENFTSHVQSKSDAPFMAYQKHYQKSFCFSSLASALKVSNQLAAENKIKTHISSLLSCEILDRVMFSNAIMTYKKYEKETNIQMSL